MTQARLEHANITVPDAKTTAAELCSIFDWKIRWEGEAKDNGHTVYVGEDHTYLAIYTPAAQVGDGGITHTTRGGLNHIGVVVQDLDAMEHRLKTAGYTPHAHGNYEPGRRFYFDSHDGIEIEVISYT
ncbi:VOC family protein [Actibacterium sp. 188UL27-1]|uniref:VOC family protein n=1 Tax=Actibacterium sp. 188UL27-1 TaxID=2786961 RepID=UPI00195C944A|nr:VOC family protein [Actibacterium sp. 188UL27-1]MBM7068110.1 VOC family protein [Actibacterium sp. 188UL27-1]